MIALLSIIPSFTPNGMFCVNRFIRRLTTMVLIDALFLLEEDNSVLSVNDIDELFPFYVWFYLTDDLTNGGNIIGKHWILISR